MPKVHANGLTFHVNRYRTGGDGDRGDRPVVVLIHGLGIVDNAAATFVLGFHLAKDAEVITYDLRGHGRSDFVLTGYRVEDHVDDLVGVLDALDVAGPVHLIGFSYGGAIALAATMRHPERVASISLLDGFVPVAGWEKPLYGMVANWEDWLDRIRAQGVVRDEDIEELVISGLTEIGDPSRRRVSAMLRRVRTLFESTSLRDDMKNEVSFDEDDFRRIRCPVLGVYGEKSDLYDVTELLPRLLGDVTVHTLPGTAHLALYMRVDVVRPLVREFLGLPAGT